MITERRESDEFEICELDGSEFELIEASEQSLETNNLFVYMLILVHLQLTNEGTGLQMAVHGCQHALQTELTRALQ